MSTSDDLNDWPPSPDDNPADRPPPPQAAPQDPAPPPPAVPVDAGPPQDLMQGSTSAAGDLNDWLPPPDGNPADRPPPPPAAPSDPAPQPLGVPVDKGSPPSEPGSIAEADPPENLAFASPPESVASPPSERAGEFGSAPDGVTGPRLFLSYRTADTADIVGLLAEELRNDLGRSCVFRDNDDLVAGQDWRQVLFDRLGQMDSVVVVIGPDWLPNRKPDDDVAAAEIDYALDPSTKPSPIPVVVDTTTTELRSQLGTDPLARLFDLHAVETTRPKLVDPGTVDYQRVLLGVWHSLTSHLEDRVLIIGSYATAELSAFLNELKTSTPIEARDLSRLGADVVVASVNQKRRKAKRWPDVIVLVESDDHQRRRNALLQAIDQHPAYTSVALVGVGGAAGAAAAAAAVSGLGGSSGSTVVAHAGVPQLAATVPASTGTGLLAGSGLAVKIGAGVVVAGAVTTAAVVVLPDDGQDFGFATAALAVNRGDDRAFPLGTPGGAEVRIGDPVGAAEPAAAGEPFESWEERSIVVKLPGEEPIDFGTIRVPTGFSAEGAENNADGVFTVAEATTEVELTYQELWPFDFCFEVADPSQVVGGWQYTGRPAEVEVGLEATMEDGELTAANPRVIVRAESERVLLAQLDESFDLSRCPEIREGTVAWG